MAANPVTSSNFVFCPPLPGKPGPYKADGMRTRVPQPEQKGDTCVYYALQILRNEHRIGKNPPESLAAKRDVEEVISKHRKDRSKVDALFKPQLAFAEMLKEQTWGGPCTKQKAREFVAKQMHLIASESQMAVSIGVRSFCAQNTYDDFSDYINASYQKALMKVHEAFLEKRGQAAEFIEHSALVSLKQSWKEMPLWRKEFHEQNLVFEESYLSYGCKRSSWHPEQGIKGLMTQLDLHGPHLIKGKFGQSYYEVAASEQPQKIEGRTISYWKAEAPRKEGIVSNHAIVVVGAKIASVKVKGEIKEQQLVYFLDPLDSSDPKDPSTQKIYVMSYDRLKTSIASLRGQQLVSPVDRSPLFFKQEEGENNYALYMPKSS